MAKKSLLCSCLFALTMSANAHAQDAPRRVVVEDIPSVKNITYVSASRTRSGYPVPRYVSLKFDKVNGRKGPSLKHEISWQYQRRGLPLIVVAETDMWRRVRDINGDESWIRKPALSGIRTVVTIEETAVHAKPRETSRIEAIATKDAVLTLSECHENGWCKIKDKSGIKGWAPQYKLWGATPLY